MRVIKEIEIEGKKVNAIFDTRANFSYVNSSIIPSASRRPVARPYKIGLGGEEIEVKEECLFHGKIEGLEFSGKAIPIEKTWKIDGKEVSAIIGALIMEEWEITINSKTGELGLEKLRTREFTEL